MMQQKEHTTMKKPKLFYGWWMVLGGTIVMAFSTPMVNALSSLYVVPITEDLGLTRSAYVLTSTITAIAAILILPVIGSRMTHQNMIRIQIGATVVLAMAYASFAAAQNLFHLYISSFFIGLTFMAAGMIPVSVMVANWFVKKQGLAMSIVLAGIGLGGTILSPLMTRLILNYGWRFSRLFLSSAYLVLILPILMFLIKATPEEKGLRAYGEEDASAETEAEADAFQTQKKYTQLEVLIEPLSFETEAVYQNRPGRHAKAPRVAGKSGYRILFMVGMLTSGIICGGGTQHISAFNQDFHGAVFAGLVVSVYAFAGIFGKLLLGWINDRFGSSESLIFGGVLFAASFALMAVFEQSQGVMILAAVFFGIGISIGSVNTNLLTYAIFGKAEFSHMFGVSKSVQQAGMALGPLILALFYDTQGDYRMAWIFSTVICVLTVLSLVKSHRLSKRARDTEKSFPQKAS
jgi:MFS family permease